MVKFILQTRYLQMNGLPCEGHDVFRMTSQSFTNRLPCFGIPQSNLQPKLAIFFEEKKKAIDLTVMSSTCQFPFHRFPFHT